MRRIAILLTAIALLFALTACGKKADPPAFTEPEEITMTYLEEKTIPFNLIGIAGGFQIDYRNNDETNAGLYGSTTVMRFLYDGETILINQCADFDNGEFTHLFYTSDLDDTTMYVEDNNGASKNTIAQTEVQNLLNDSLFGINYLDCELTDYTKSDDGFSVGYDASQDGTRIQHVTLLVNPQSGLVESGTIEYYENGNLAGTNYVTFTYSRSIAIDRSPYEKYTASGSAEEPQTDEQTDNTKADDTKTDGFTFSATDPDGGTHTYSEFAESKLLMVNFWEPWCSPCVGELPDLERLYQAYKDKGFDILGVYTTEEDAQSVAEQCGITYPIVKSDDRLAAYSTDAVPTTIFVGDGGKVLTDEPYVGARSYEEWEAIIQEYLG